MRERFKIIKKNIELYRYLFEVYFKYFTINIKFHALLNIKYFT